MTFWKPIVSKFIKGTAARTAARTAASIIPSKPAAQEQVESAFLFKDFLSFTSMQRWLINLLFILSLNAALWLLSKIGAISPVTKKSIYYFEYCVVFFFFNYLILYIGIKIYRGFTRYVLPFIKASVDLPFRLHQKLLEMF